MSEEITLSEEDWALLRKATVLAGVTVAIGAFSGPAGTQAELRAIGEGLQRAAQEFPGNPLVRGLVSEETRREAEGYAPQFLVAPSQKEAADFRMAALNRCAQMVDMLNVKAPAAEAAEVKQAIVMMCEHVAARSVERGAPAGAGNDRVDPREAAAVDAVRRTLWL